MTKTFLILFLLLSLSVNCFSGDCKTEQAQSKRFFRMAQEQVGKNKLAREKFLIKALKIINTCELFDNTQKIKILLSLGQLKYSTKEKKEEAVSFFQRASELERISEFPNSFTFVILGDAYASLHDIKEAEKAVEAYEEALEIDNFSSETLKTKTKSNLKKLLAWISRVGK